MSSNSLKTRRSEDEIGKKWDRCLSDLAVKFVGGLTIGVVASVVVFKRRPWVVWLGGGVGFGMGFNNCNLELQNPGYVKGRVEKLPSDMNSDDKNVRNE